MNNTFSENLRKLRLSKQYTQEQVAELLKVSPQSVSRWECGNTFPDIMLLPEIARLYSVTVDDLYRENTYAYPNYAARLSAIYEESHALKDFIRADAEYSRILKTGQIKYSMAFCYEEMGEYQKAYDMWIQIAEDGERDGFEIESKMPRERAAKCREKL